MSKKINILTLFCCLLAGSLNAQWQTSGSNVYFNNGNVGIGTTTPESKLAIWGEDYKTLHLKSPTSPLIKFSSSYNQGDGAELYQNQIGDVLLNINSTKYGIVIKSTGDVGLGTPSPAYKLDVVGAVNADQYQAKINKSSLGCFLTDTKVYDQKILGHYALGWYSDSWDNVGPSLWMSGYAGIKLFTTGTPRFVINAIGNVGIGTTTPTAKLTVAGDIKAREVKIEVNAGADFVFDETYQLRPLREVESFIKENKHLPDIASANQMVENGIDMGKMQVHLLQKIEELTLYVIELQKQNQKQQEEIEILKQSR